MSNVAQQQPPLNKRVEALGRVMSQLPQAELETKHHFADGMYAREVFREKGTVIVGKVHKKEHFYVILSGCVDVTTDKGVERIHAPRVIVSQPGTQRAVHAVEDSICITFHRTDNTDLSEIENELVEPCAFALFNEQNKLLENQS
jgi:quercetin dioxygenase-like cupin family protein